MRGPIILRQASAIVVMIGPQSVAPIGRTDLPVLPPLELVQSGRGRGAALASLHTRPQPVLSIAMSLFIIRRKRRSTRTRSRRRPAPAPRVLDDTPFLVESTLPCTNCARNKVGTCHFNTRINPDICTGCIETGGCAGAGKSCCCCLLDIANVAASIQSDQP